MAVGRQSSLYDRCKRPGAVDSASGNTDVDTLYWTSFVFDT